MGVNKLMEFLSKNGILPLKTSFSEFEGKTIAIDMSILLHRIISSFKPLSYKGKITTHIFGVFMKIYEMILSKITVVAVFDGKPPSIKNKTESKQYLSDTIIKDIKILLRLMGVNVIQSPGEADTQCAYLSNNNLIDAVYSRDTDMLVFGCNTVLFSLSKYSGMRLDLSTIFDKLNINKNQFIDICNILGNDYYPGIKGIGVSKVLDYLKNDKNKNNLHDKHFINAKKYYMLKNVKVKKNITIKKTKPEFSKLLFHLVEELGFNNERTLRKIENLRSIYE